MPLQSEHFADSAVCNVRTAVRITGKCCHSALESLLRGVRGRFPGITRKLSLPQDKT